MAGRREGSPPQSWSAPRYLPEVVVFIAATVAGCVGPAALWHIPLLDAYLATSPGGIYSVLAIARDTDAGPVVSTLQVRRMVVMLVAAVSLSKILGARRRAPDGCRTPFATREDRIVTDPLKFFDAHFHIIDQRFPLYENNGFIPEEFTATHYRDRVTDLNVVGGAIVSGSFQKFDQSYLLDALDTLGAGFVGVTQIPHNLPDAEIVELGRCGIRAVRFNLARGGSAEIEHLDRLARRVHELASMHVELYVDARSLPDIADTLAALPAVSIDHLGMHADGLPPLLSLVERGVHVKATGFGRVELDVADTIRAVLKVNPAALTVGTDLPSTRARRPFHDTDLDLVAYAAGDHVQAVMYDNATALYRIGDRY